MRPIRYDQKQIDDEYRKDRMREAEMARLALAAEETPAAPRGRIDLAWAAQLGAALQRGLTRSITSAGEHMKALRDDVRHLAHGITHRLRHQ